MGTDTTYAEWHLTPRGWVEGDWSVSCPPPQSTTPPMDRIETWQVKETSHDVYPTRPQREWKLVWASPENTEADRKKLRAKTRTPANESTNPRRAFWDFPL